MAGVVKELPEQLSPGFLQGVINEIPVEDFVPPAVTETQKKVALQRKWVLINPGAVAPEDMNLLSKIIPSGLSPEELNRWLYGSMMEAQKAYLIVFNGSWTKRVLDLQIRIQGLPHVLESFDDKTRQNLEGARRLLSD